MEFTPILPPANPVARGVVPVAEKLPHASWQLEGRISDVPIKPALKHVQGKPENDDAKLAKKTVRFALPPLETDDAESRKSGSETATGPSSPEAPLSSEPPASLPSLREDVARRRLLPVPCPSVPLKPTRPAPLPPATRVVGPDPRAEDVRPAIGEMNYAVNKMMDELYEKKRTGLENDIREGNSKLEGLKKMKVKRRGSNPVTRLVYFFTRFSERSKIRTEINLTQKQLDADKNALKQLNSDKKESERIIQMVETVSMEHKGLKARP